MTALSSLNDSLELGASSLDLSTSVGDLLDFLIWVLLCEVVIACQNCAFLRGKVSPLEQLSILDGFSILLLLFTQVIIVEAGWVVDCNRLISPGS